MIWPKRHKPERLLLPRYRNENNLGNIILFLIVWFLIAGGAALFFEIWPRTALGWGVVFAFGPVALFAVEACGEALNTTLAHCP